MKPNPETSYVVITVCRPLGDYEYYGDVLLVTPNKIQAHTIKDKVNAREPIPGLVYDNLMDFDEAQVISLHTGFIIQNTDEE